MFRDHIHASGILVMACMYAVNDRDVHLGAEKKSSLAHCIEAKKSAMP